MYSQEETLVSPTLDTPPLDPEGKARYADADSPPITTPPAPHTEHAHRFAGYNPSSMHSGGVGLGLQARDSPKNPFRPQQPQPLPGATLPERHLIHNEPQWELWRQEHGSIRRIAHALRPSPVGTPLTGDTDPRLPANRERYGPVEADGGSVWESVSLHRALGGWVDAVVNEGEAGSPVESKAVRPRVNAVRF